MKYVIEEYVTSTGRKPFAEWALGLKDRRALARIRTRVARAELGNFGDWKSIQGAAGLFEMRDDYGPGYRIFYSIVGRKVILLLAGSTKGEQDRTIARAKEYLADYERRTKR